MERPFDTAMFIRVQSYCTELYSKFIEDEGEKCGLSKPEADVLLFFANNPDFHSAVDAARYRGVSKAYVSKALVRLSDKGYITARVDENDHRYQKIFITEKAGTAINRLQNAQQSFAVSATRYLSREEKLQLIALLDKVGMSVSRVYADTLGDGALYRPEDR